MPTVAELAGDNRAKPKRMTWQEILAVTRMWTGPLKAEKAKAARAAQTGRVPPRTKGGQ